MNFFFLSSFLGACRSKKTWPVSYSQEELRKRLTPKQYHVTQERGTERLGKKYNFDFLPFLISGIIIIITNHSNNIVIIEYYYLMLFNIFNLIILK